MDEKTRRPEDLQEMIHRAEVAVAQLKGSGEKTLSFLILLDEIQSLMQQFEERGADLGPERVRMQTVGNMLHTRAPILVKEMKAVGGLAKARQEVNPPESHWWWYLDRHIAEQRRLMLRRWLIIGGVVAVLIVVVVVAYRTFLAPSPEVRQRYEYAMRAEQRLADGDLAGAVADYEAARAVAPDDPEVHLWLGVLYEEQGRMDEATASFATAKALIGDELGFLVRRAMIYNQMDKADATLADANAAVALDPESAIAHFLLGGAYEAQGNIPQALEEFEKAAQLAEQAGDSALFVQARMRMGMILQSPPQLVTPTKEGG